MIFLNTFLYIPIHINITLIIKELKIIRFDFIWICIISFPLCFIPAYKEPL